MGTAELLLHPIRLRIVHALTGGQAMTTAELRERLSDVPKPSMYRHLALLVDAGILVTDSEQVNRGNLVQRRYRLDRAKSVVDAGDAARASKDDHRRIFAAAISVLVAEFNGYLDQADADPSADLVGYRQHTAWLTADELGSMIEELRAALVPRLQQGPEPGRRPYLISPIMFPTKGLPAAEAVSDAEPESPS